MISFDSIWFHGNKDHIACSGFGRSATSRHVRSPATGFSQELYPFFMSTQARPWQQHLIATLPRVCWGQPQAAGGAQSHPSLNNIILISLNRKMTDDDEDGESKSSKIWNAFQAVVSLMSGGGVGVGDKLDTLDTDLVQEKFWCTNSVENSDAQIVLEIMMRK